MTKENLTPARIRELWERKQHIKVELKKVKGAFKDKSLVVILGRAAKGVAGGKSLSKAVGLPDDTVLLIEEFLAIDETLDAVIGVILGNMMSEVAYEVQS